MRGGIRLRRETLENFSASRLSRRWRCGKTHSISANLAVATSHLCAQGRNLLATQRLWSVQHREWKAVGEVGESRRAGNYLPRLSPTIETLADVVKMLGQVIAWIKVY